MNPKSVLFEIVSKTNITSLMRQLHDPGLSIFMFHGFTDHPPSHLENSCDLHLQIDEFSNLCAWMQRHAHVISLSEALTLQRLGRPLPKGSVVLTFDDGYASNYHLAFPLLQRYEMPATVFVATDFVDNRAWLWPDRLEYSLGHTAKTSVRTSIGGIKRNHSLASQADRRRCALELGDGFKQLPQENLAAEICDLEAQLEASLRNAATIPDIYEPLTWSQVKNMHGSGLVEFGGHTHQHLILSRCQPETIRRELKTSTSLLSAVLGTPPKLFAYPNGKAGDFNEQTRQALQEAGYEGAVITTPGFNHSKTVFDPYALRRFGQPQCPAHLDIISSGFPQWLSRLSHKATSRAAL